MVNPVLLPPGVEPPEEWQEWQETIDLVRFVRAIEANQSLDVEADVSVDTLVQEGVTAIAIDAEPFRSLTPGGVNRYRVALNPIFGQPIDLGCAMVWWLDPEQPAPEPMENASQWRDHLEKELAETPAPALNTLIRPMWNRLRPKTD